MKLSHVKGNTWVMEAMELIPLYKLDNRRCVLLDSGLGEERESMDAALAEHGLTPVGILCSHTHVDHCGNNGYLQRKYGASVALTAPEAGMASSLLNLKCYFLTLPPGIVERESSGMIHTPDVIVPPGDGPFTFCGVEFGIIQTPGHSSGHICTVTPDGVCYTADALLSREYLESKLPYNLSQSLAIRSRQKLRELDCDLFIMAHGGVCTAGELGGLIDDNDALARRRAEEILGLVTRPMTASEIVQATCERYQLLTRKPQRALRFERNTRFFIEHLVDEGLLTMECRRGVTLYRRAEEQEKPPAL